MALYENNKDFSLNSASAELGINRASLHSWITKYGTGKRARIKAVHDKAQAANGSETSSWVGAFGLDAHFKHYRCTLAIKRPKCARETTSLIHHSDHGLGYVRVAYNERLAQHGIVASTGTVGD